MKESSRNILDVRKSSVLPLYTKVIGVLCKGTCEGSLKYGNCLHPCSSLSMVSLPLWRRDNLITTTNQKLYVSSSYYSSLPHFILCMPTPVTVLYNHIDQTKETHSENITAPGVVLNKDIVQGHCSLTFKSLFRLTWRVQRFQSVMDEMVAKGARPRPV